MCFFSFPQLVPQCLWIFQLCLKEFSTIRRVLWNLRFSPLSQSRKSSICLRNSGVATSFETPRSRMPADLIGDTWSCGILNFVDWALSSNSLDRIRSAALQDSADSAQQIPPGHSQMLRYRPHSQGG